MKTRKLRKLLSLLLVSSMAFALAACGSSDTSDAADTAEDTATESSADEETAADVGDVADDPAVTLVMSTSKNQTEQAGMVLDYFCDLVEENSGGSITFNRNYGGTLYSSAEELGAVQDGSIHVTALAHSSFADYLPLWQFPNFASEDNTAPVTYMEYMLNSAGEATDLLVAENEDQGIVMLDFIAGGSSVLTSTFEFDELSETFSKKFGTGVNAAAYESIGFSVVNMEVSDGYEDLRTGVVDLAVMSFAPTVEMSWYEEAPYYYYCGTHSAGNPITINADMWNSLTEAQQEVMKDAAAQAAAYSIEIVDTNEEEYTSIVEEAGGFVKAMSDEDTEFYFSNYFTAIAEDSYARGVEYGIADEMATVLNASADYFGVDISSIFE